MRDGSSDGGSSMWGDQTRLGPGAYLKLVRRGGGCVRTVGLQAYRKTQGWFASAWTVGFRGMVAKSWQARGRSCSFGVLPH